VVGDGHVLIPPLASRLGHFFDCAALAIDDFSFGNGIWGNHYHDIFDLHQSEVKGLAEHNIALAGAAIVLQAKLFQELVDLYGDLPYSQTFNVALTTTPAYDKAQDVYNALQKRLDTAITYLNTTPSNAFANADIINHGKTAPWILLANTIKLRLLIRQSEISGFSPASMRRSRGWRNNWKTARRPLRILTTTSKTTGCG